MAELGGAIVATLTLLAEAEGHVAHLCIDVEERGDAIGARLLEEARAGLGITIVREVATCA